MNRQAQTVLIILILASINVFAQNLAPNPSFEEYESCPAGPSRIELPFSISSTLVGWCRPTKGSSDYFNACNDFAVSVPDNIFGYQEAKSGDAYIGLFTAYGLVDYREYIQGQLAYPLIAGNRYLVCYWVSPSEISYRPHDRMGALFLNEYLMDSASVERITIPPQIESPAGLFFSDNTQWHRVMDTFTATGGENWMIIGCFPPTDELHFPEGDDPSVVGYYYVDDVCVLDLDGTPAYSSTTDSCTSIPITLSGRDGYQMYIWHDGDTTQTRTFNLYGSYWVKSINYEQCIMAIDTFNIDYEFNVDLDLGNDTVLCDKDSIYLNVYNPIFEYYLWNTGDLTPDYMVYDEGTYYVTARGKCVMASDTITIRQYYRPKLRLPNDTIICIGESITLAPLNPPDHPVTYNWNTGATTEQIDIQEAGRYVLTIENICGYTATDSIDVSTTGCSDCIWVPNAFSPNSDGLNDKFEIKTNECTFESFRLIIFDRWGNIIFQSFSINDMWDGKGPNGKTCDMGVYHYLLEAKPVLSTQKIIEKGEITLLR